MDPLDNDPDDTVNSFLEHPFGYVSEDQGADMVEFSRPSYCIKCMVMTGHNTPPRLVVLKNGRPAMSSFCWRCRSRKFRLVSFRFYRAKTGRRLENCVLFS